MTYTYRCLIVIAANQQQAQAFCAQLAGPPGEGMFATPLTPNGRGKRTGFDADGLPVYESDPPPTDGSITHYISAGAIENDFAAVLSDPAVMTAACAAMTPPVDGATLDACTALLASSDISEDSPFEALDRLGLQLLPQTEGNENA